MKEARKSKNDNKKDEMGKDEGHWDSPLQRKKAWEELGDMGG